MYPGRTLLIKRIYDPPPPSVNDENIDKNLHGVTSREKKKNVNKNDFSFERPVRQFYIRVTCVNYPSKK